MKLVTWNIQWCRGCDGRVDPQRIVDHARAFADFDVLCLQEVAANFATLKGSEGEDQFALLAALLPGFTPVVGTPVDVAGADGSRRTFGNMILSRLPVEQVLRIQLPWPADPAVRSMPRMLLEAVVRAPFGPLRVMTTHLEYYSQTQRAAQLEAVRARHAEACGHALDDRARSDSGDPFQAQPQTVSAVLTGDFNFRAEDSLHARMTAPFDDARVPALDDAWQSLHPGQAQPPTIGVHDCDQWPAPFACDFIFASRDLRPRLRSVAVETETEASDHQPVLLELA
jgi:endonuclease/exonuclease/phosphatase family metal-dependent hydrolase